ncbi:hypothetical protein BPJM79_60016 [Bacillus pumilus]
MPFDMLQKLRNLCKGNQFLRWETCGIFIFCLSDRGKERE